MPVIVVDRGDVKGCGMNDVIVSGEFDDPLKFNEHGAEQCRQFQQEPRLGMAKVRAMLLAG